ncbi:hypothetical protein VQ300_001252 [Salmonella enterica]|nr:hypothetical protein [Salmonella enterica]
MTIITKEWLQQTIAEFENTRDDIPFGLNDDDARILIVLKRALASLDAKPVAWECGENIILFNPDTVEAYAKRAEISPKPLYAAPSAQVVSIPDDWQTCEKLSDDSYVDNALRELVEDTTGDNGVRVVQAVIRALRDSGLIRTYPDLSQPVDPQVSEYEKIMLQAGWVR